MLAEFSAKSFGKTPPTASTKVEEVEQLNIAELNEEEV